jgi:hypothetical protein
MTRWTTNQALSDKLSSQSQSTAKADPRLMPLAWFPIHDGHLSLAGESDERKGNTAIEYYRTHNLRCTQNDGEKEGKEILRGS